MRGKYSTNRNHNIKNKLDYSSLWQVFWKGYYHRSEKAREKYLKMFLNEYINEKFTSNKATTTYELFKPKNLILN